MLILLKNEVKRKYFNTLRSIKLLEEEIQINITIEHFNIVKNSVETAREKMFTSSKSKLLTKFNKLNFKGPNSSNWNKSTIKEVTLNLCQDEIPANHKSLLDLGPKFVPSINSIPYMDIISKTESTALKLQYDRKENESLTLRQDVLRILKMSKPPKPNLTKDQRIALKEIKKDENVSIFPYDKGAGLVRISNEVALKKIEEQIGHTKIITTDPTSKIVRKTQNTLRSLKNKFTIKEYRDLYPSDGIPPRMYGVIKAHKPQKNFPMRIIVSTVGTPTYEISKYLVQIIQPTLNKNKTRLINSRTYIESRESLFQS